MELPTPHIDEPILPKQKKRKTLERVDVDKRFANENKSLILKIPLNEARCVGKISQYIVPTLFEHEIRYTIDIRCYKVNKRSVHS